MSNKTVKSGGMGFISILTLIFIVLKLTNNIDWSWLWVLSPLWISMLLFIILFAIIMIGGRIKKGHWECKNYKFLRRIKIWIYQLENGK